MNRSLADRLNRLFDVMHAASAPALSNTAVAEAITRRVDVRISPDEMWQLRAGTKPDATVQQLSAIAEFFGVPSRYLTDPHGDAVIDSQLTLLEALRDAGVREVRRSGIESLSPQARIELARTIARTAI